MRNVVIGIWLLIGLAGCAAPPPDPNRTERMPARSSVENREQVRPGDQPANAPALPIVPPGAPPPHATDSMSGPGNTGLTKPN